MMKLKHLFGNIDLAQMLLANWTIAEGQQERVQHFRSSANAVYILPCDDRTFFLRVTPVEEKAPGAIRAELDFLHYLHSEGYPAVRSVPAAGGEAFVTADTPWGPHSMVVFEKVPGKPMGRVAYSDAVYEGYGQSLGRLHHLSRGYQPREAARDDWRVRLDWCERMATEYHADPLVLTEARLLRTFFGAMPCAADSYGLVHYDFELDNVFYDEASRLFTPIDFDDSIYHWYALDVEQTIDSIREDGPEGHRDEAISCFLAGYRKHMPLDEESSTAMPAFRRFADLYGYVRCLRSLHEHWQNEPQWMQGLRGIIQRIMTERQKAFGQPLG